MRYLAFVLFFLAHSGYAYSQDSARIYFLNKQISLQAGDKIILDSKDTSLVETLFNIGGGKYLYIKSSVADSIPVEFGQLSLHFANHALYLLREGPWLIENDEEKLLCTYRATDDDVEEFPISNRPAYVNQNSIKSHGKSKKRRVRFVSVDSR